MQKQEYKNQFAERLRALMIKQGHGSASAASGASPAALCKAIGSHPEMALRYLDGRSIPSPDVIVKMAKWLSVTPGELLFGDNTQFTRDENALILDKEIFSYVIEKMIPVIRKSHNDQEILAFLLSTLSDLAEMDIDNNKLKQVIDLMIRSTHVLSSTRAEGYGKSEAKDPIAS